MDKNQRRESVLKARDGLTKEEAAEKSQRITERLKREDVGENVMVFLAFGNECCLDDYIAYLLSSGRNVYVPYCLGKGIMKASRLLDMENDLEEGYFGIRAPKEGCRRFVEPEVIDTVIVPGVSFDRRGNRLGFGGGYYDRYLPQTRPDCGKIAVCFEVQISDALDPDEHDFPMDRVVTEDHVYVI